MTNTRDCTGAGEVVVLLDLWGHERHGRGHATENVQNCLIAVHLQQHTAILQGLRHSGRGGLRFFSLDLSLQQLRVDIGAKFVAVLVQSGPGSLEIRRI